MEWIFYVIFLKVGIYFFLIKIFVVEIVQGKERVREIVWEEKVEIYIEQFIISFGVLGFRFFDYCLQFGD